MKPRSDKNLVKKYMMPAMIIIIVGIGMAVTKQPIHAASKRAKTVAGVLFGGTAGGGVASIAGSAKWFPLGFGAGGLAGGLIARHIRKRKQHRRAHNASYSAKRTKSYHPHGTQEQSLQPYDNRIRRTYTPHS